jgi:hypothetical protein
MGKQTSSALSKLLLKPADIPEYIEDFRMCCHWQRKTYRREQTKPNALYEDQCEVQRSKGDGGDHEVLQPNVKVVSLKEQFLSYGDIPDDDPIDYHNVEVGQGIPEELADAIESTITSAAKKGMSRDVVQSLRQFVTECKDFFRLKLGADPPANVKPFVIKLRKGADSVRI